MCLSEHRLTKVDSFLWLHHESDCVYSLDCLSKISGQHNFVDFERKELCKSK